MKTQGFNFISLCLIFSFILNANENIKTLALIDPTFTNAIANFVGTMENMGFIKTEASQSGHSIEENGTTKTIFGTNLTFARDDNKSMSIGIHYSETAFFAANTFTNLLREIASSGLLPSPNTTYQTDFIVLSDYDKGVVTKHASVVLISTNLVAQIKISSDPADSLQDMSQVIKQVEITRDALSAER